MSKSNQKQWWNSLSLKQQLSQISKWQAKRHRKTKVLRFDPKYPWCTEGVNKDNKEQWLEMIFGKNPWLLGL